MKPRCHGEAEGCVEVVSARKEKFRSQPPQVISIASQNRNIVDKLGAAVKPIQWAAVKKNRVLFIRQQVEGEKKWTDVTWNCPNKKSLFFFFLSVAKHLKTCALMKATLVYMACRTRPYPMWSLDSKQTPLLISETTERKKKKLHIGSVSGRLHCSLATGINQWRCATYIWLRKLASEHCYIIWCT